MTLPSAVGLEPPRLFLEQAGRTLNKCVHLAECLDAGRVAHFRRRHAEDPSEAVREVTVAPEPEPDGDAPQVRSLLAHHLQRVTQTKLVAIFVDRKPRMRSEQPRQVKRRCVDPRCHVGQRDLVRDRPGKPSLCSSTVRA